MQQQLQRRRGQLQQQQERLYRHLTRLDPQVDALYQTQAKIQRHLHLGTTTTISTSSSSSNNINNRKERLCQAAQKWRFACNDIQQALLQQVETIIVQAALEIHQHCYHHHRPSTTTAGSSSKATPTLLSNSELTTTTTTCTRLLERLLLRLGHLPGVDLDKGALRHYWEQQQQRHHHQQGHVILQQQQEGQAVDHDETILAWRVVFCLLRRVIQEGQSQQSSSSFSIHGGSNCHAAARISNDDDDFTIETCIFRFQPAKLLLAEAAAAASRSTCSTSRPTQTDSLHEC